MRGSWAPILAISLCTGCLSKPAPSLSDPDPLLHIPAMHKAANANDAPGAQVLVNDLDSDDPAIRLYAINALERIAGERFGYVHYQTEDQRRPAVAKWRQWLKSRESSDIGPATATTGVAP